MIEAKARRPVTDLVQEFGALRGVPVREERRGWWVFGGFAYTTLVPFGAGEVEVGYGEAMSAIVPIELTAVSVLFAADQPVEFELDHRSLSELRAARDTRAIGATDGPTPIDFGAVIASTRDLGSALEYCVGSKHSSSFVAPLAWSGARGWGMLESSVREVAPDGSVICELSYIYQGKDADGRLIEAAFELVTSAVEVLEASGVRLSVMPYSAPTTHSPTRSEALREAYQEMVLLSLPLGLIPLAGPLFVGFRGGRHFRGVRWGLALAVLAALVPALLLSIGSILWLNVFDVRQQLGQFALVGQHTLTFIGLVLGSRGRRPA